jgi:amino acid transporter
MKKFELRMAFAMFIITTLLIITLMFSFEDSNAMETIVTFVSITGYLTSYLYYDAYKKKQNI